MIPLVPGDSTGCSTTGADHWTCDQHPWPSEWTELHIKMRFAAL